METVLPPTLVAERLGECFIYNHMYYQRILDMPFEENEHAKLVITGDRNKPVQLPDVPPPPRIYPALNYKLRLAMWLSWMCGMVAIAAGSYQYYTNAQLQTSGVKVIGKLTASGELFNGHAPVVIDYQPEKSEDVIRQQFSVSEKQLKVIQEQQQTPVIYLPSNPHYACLGEKVKHDTEPFAIGCGMLFLSGLIKWYFHRQSRALDNYLADGLKQFEASQTGN